MKLIQVEAHGFKSFADKITLKFNGGVAAIIGPNGSGKSNINDAIRWVLGETSSKALRGDNMEDVIFAGSKTEKEMDRAEVVLTFDNKDRAISVQDDFFTISRVLNRGKGSNEYYINGEIARQRDIKEIAMQSGISKSSLAIISQGTISDIAEATPERRREIFEEASGTSMYRSKKQEAMRKLERTQEALNQIEIVVQELEKQIKPLQKQAEKAKIYTQKTQELKDLEVSLLIHDFIEHSQNLEKLSTESLTYSQEKEDLEIKIKMYSDIVEQKSDLMANLDSTITKLSTQIDEITNQITNLEIRAAREEKHREMLINGEITVDNKQKKAALKDELSSIHTKISIIKEFIQKQKQEINSLNEKIVAIAAKKQDIKNEIDFQKDKVQKINSKLDYLLNIKNSRNNLQKGTRNIVNNAHLFKGFKALVIDLIGVDTQYKIAIETILANALHHIVVDNSETAVKAIEFLKNNNGGRATFIPLGSIAPKHVVEHYAIAAQTQKGFIGIASDLVVVEKEYEILKKFLLGNILVVDNIENANKISKLLEKRYMVVTLDGDIIRVGGVLSGGQKNEDSSLLGLDEQIKDLESQKPSILSDIAQKNEIYINLEQEEKNLGILLSNISLDIRKQEFLLESNETKFDELRIKYESISDEKIDELKVVDIASEIQKLILEKSNLIATRNSQNELLQTTKKEFSDANTKKSIANNELNILITNNANKIAEKTKSEVMINNITKRLAEQYNMLFETAKEFYNPDIDFEVARKIVDDLKNDIKELGYVNLNSIAQLEEVESRYNEVKTQEKDIIEAKRTIEEVIDEMDKIIIQRITETVSLANEEFKYVFSKMFGGGTAEIRYTDPDNLLESGIDVMAQPPGKSIKNLKLFSGGEKALIAISLLFSILKAKPLPLCILDEVEAALDEANVIRFAEFLQNLKENTQFIVITHRQGTMERVDKLYGATMQKRGVTSFFSVNLTEAKKLIN
ncbi:AAA family ATPase [Metamycoplasma alkalescens]|uniref:Chromosome partition protein Smc n=1 Tax=Metamycoplasma alkalescens TaxID=45363 RepID=A0A318U483_9BACT|nr:AAA family ATPase [Metamycoplasma alkalescens]PYF42184.1 chromosome segregation protein [Metamycoplasma alkalescens]SYV90492.1 ABC transporter ATP-binding protein [Metamycoplasma alkalescens]